MVCPRCGKVLKAGYAYCSHCGWDLKRGVSPGPAYNPAGHAYPPYLVPPRRIEPMALASFICGLVSFFIIPLLPAIAALVLGIAGRNRIKECPHLYEGDTYAVVGIILGAVNIFLTLAVILVAVATVLSHAGM